VLHNLHQILFQDISHEAWARSSIFWPSILLQQQLLWQQMWIQSNSIIFVGQNFASVKDNCRSKITISKSLNLCPPYKKEIRGSPEIIDREWEVLAFGRGCSPFPALVLCSAPRPLGFRVARTTRAPCPAHAAYPHTRSYAPPPFPVELELLSRDEGKGREGRWERGWGALCNEGTR
jgi:hypothetical protein